jgi:hypothetical protein
VDPDGWLGSFLDGRKKPVPVADGPVYKQEYYIRELAQTLAELTATMAAGDYSLDKIKAGLQDIVIEAGRQGDFQQAGILDIRIVNVVPPTAGDAGPGVVFEVYLRGGPPLQGYVNITAGAQKPSVLIWKRLEQSRTNLQTLPQQLPPPEPEDIILTQQICTDTVVSWSQTGG